MNQIQSQFSIDHYVLWTALVTPFDSDGAIDFQSLSSLAYQQEKADNGILLLGSTGEGLSLNADEQLAIVKHICNLQLSVPIMVAVGGYQLTEQLNWMSLCNQLPIHAYLLGAPLYAKPGPKGQQHWFEALLNQAQFPCMLYNVPSRSGISLSTQALSQLQHHPKCWALKEASGDINQFLDYRASCPEIALYSGEDSLMPYLAAAGAKGLVSVSANVWPQPTHEYVNSCLAGQLENTFPVWDRAIASLFDVANPVPAKALMAELGDISHSTLRPPLIAEELEELSVLLESNQQINAWYQALKVKATASLTTDFD